MAGRPEGDFVPSALTPMLAVSAKPHRQKISKPKIAVPAAIFTLQ
jgi:hypothetical protein